MSETPLKDQSVALAFSSLDAALGKTIDDPKGLNQGSPDVSQRMNTLNNSSLFEMHENPSMMDDPRLLGHTLSKR